MPTDKVAQLSDILRERNGYVSSESSIYVHALLPVGAFCRLKQVPELLFAFAEFCCSSKTSSCFPPPGAQLPRRRSRGCSSLGGWPAWPAASYSLVRPVDGVQQEPAGGWRMRRDLQAVAARVAELLGAAWSKCPLGSAPAWLSCASSGRAWRLWAARHSQEEAAPMGAPPLPRVLVLADFGGRLASMARGLLLSYIANLASLT